MWQFCISQLYCTFNVFSSFSIYIINHVKQLKTSLFRHKQSARARGRANRIFWWGNKEARTGFSTSTQSVFQRKINNFCTLLCGSPCAHINIYSLNCNWVVISVEIMRLCIIEIGAWVRSQLCKNFCYCLPFFVY